MVQPLHFADLSDFSGIVVLVKLALENTIVSTDTVAFPVLRIAHVCADQLARRCIFRKLLPQSLTDAFIQTAKEFAGLHRSQERINLDIGIPPPTMTSHVPDRNRQCFQALGFVLNVVIDKLRAGMPRLVGILKILKIRQWPAQFFRQHTVELRKTAPILSGSALSPPCDARSELTALRSLILIRVNAGVVNEHHGVQQAQWLILVINLNRAKTN